MLADLLLLKICLIRQIIINSSETLRDQGTQQWEIDPGMGLPSLFHYRARDGGHLHGFVVTVPPLSS